MGSHSSFSEYFDRLGCCVIIPTYNNAATLRGVLQGVLEFTSNIIVVNDGSSDSTSGILQEYPHLIIIELAENRGKGNALRLGFSKAEEKGFEYAISIDSDGQHYPEDLPVFLNALLQKKPLDPELLIVGSRNMDDPSVPDKSSLGNIFSSFWYWVETGIRLQDTQCGYRLYPIKKVNSFQLFTSGFELEIEVLVKAAWEGVNVINLPVRVLYDPAERVTHFRPFMDVLRIVLLNIYFVFYGILVILPKKLFQQRQQKSSASSRKRSRSPVSLEQQTK